MDHKRQHWIPKGYLKAWCDQSTPDGHEPYVWQFAKDGTTSRRKAPKKIFFEPELYTLRLSDGTRDLQVEHGLAGLEDRFVTVRDKKLTPGHPLTEEEHVILCAFVAAMKCRTPGHLNHWRSNWEQVAQMGRDLQEAMEAGESLPTSLPGSGESFSQDDVERLAAADRGSMVVPMIRTQLPLLCRMNLIVLESKDPLGFITSDEPCIWFAPTPPGWPRGIGLSTPELEITLPISPRQTLLLVHEGRSGRVPATPSILHELNRRSWQHAREHFICCANETRAEWFDVPAT